MSEPENVRARTSRAVHRARRAWLGRRVAQLRASGAVVTRVSIKKIILEENPEEFSGMKTGTLRECVRSFLRTHGIAEVPFPGEGSPADEASNGVQRPFPDFDPADTEIVRARLRGDLDSLFNHFDADRAGFVAREKRLLAQLYESQQRIAALENEIIPLKRRATDCGVLEDKLEERDARIWRLEQRIRTLQARTLADGNEQQRPPLESVVVVHSKA